MNNNNEEQQQTQPYERGRHYGVFLHSVSWRAWRWSNLLTAACDGQDTRMTRQCSSLCHSIHNPPASRSVPSHRQIEKARQWLAEDRGTETKIYCARTAHTDYGAEHWLKLDGMPAVSLSLSLSLSLSQTCSSVVEKGVNLCWAIYITGLYPGTAVFNGTTTVPQLPWFYRTLLAHDKQSNNAQFAPFERSVSGVCYATKRYNDAKRNKHV